MWNIPKALVSAFSVLLVCGSGHGQGLSSPCKGLTVYTTKTLEARDEPECRLMQAPACQRIKPASSDAIFVGHVVSIADLDGRMLVDGNCDKTLLQTVKIKVTESLVGSQGGVVTVHAGNINGLYFLPRRDYLVIARHRSDGTFDVTSCGGTKLLREAKEDLAYLRSWPSLPSDAVLYGKVRSGRDEPSRMVQVSSSLSDAAIHISGKRTATVTTNEEGSFDLRHLPPGTYTASLDTPFYTYPAATQTVDIAERGCAVIDFTIVTNRWPDGSFAQGHEQQKGKK